LSYKRSVRSNTYISDGCLISEEDYEYTLENIPVSNLPEPLLEKLIGKDWETLDMLSDLQDVHDCRDTDSWRVCLNEVASKYNLKTSEV